MDARSRRSRKLKVRLSSISDAVEYESYIDLCAHRKKQIAREVEARLAADMLTDGCGGAHCLGGGVRLCPHRTEAAEEEPHALVREQSRGVRAMAGLPSKDKKEDSDGSDNSSNEEIQLDPFCFFKRKDDKGKDSRG